MAASIFNAGARSGTRQLPWGRAVTPWPHFAFTKWEQKKYSFSSPRLRPCLADNGNTILVNASCFPAWLQECCSSPPLPCLGLVLRVGAAGVVLSCHYQGPKWLSEGTKLILRDKYLWEHSCNTQILPSSSKFPLWSVLRETFLVKTFHLSHKVGIEASKIKCEWSHLALVYTALLPLLRTMTAIVLF